MKDRSAMHPLSPPRQTVEALEQRILLAATVIVTDTSDNAADTGSLRYAINHTASGDTINFNIPTTDPGYSAVSGTFTITLATQLELTHSLTLTGPGPAQLILSGNNVARVLQVDSGVTASISGITITNGSAFGSLGGGIYTQASGAINLSNCSLSNCSASYGGGLESNGTTVVSNCMFIDDYSDYGGGLYSATGSLSVTTCTFSGNSAANGGGILGGSLTLTGSSFIQNSGSYGAAIESVAGATLNISTTSFSNNSAGSLGGAIVTAASSALNLNGCSFTGNSAGRLGGGVFNSGTATVTGCTFTGNSSGNVPGNPDGGGAIFNNLAAVLTISASTFANNAADGSGSLGGGLLNDGSATVTGATFSGNIAATEGGGISNYGTQLVVVNGTLAGNSAGTFGGAISSGSGSSPLTVINSTISGNSAAGSGGGCYIYSGATALLSNTIVAANLQTTSFAPSDLFGAVAGSYNLIGDGGSGGLVNGVTGNVVGVASPGLTPLGNYGGPTMTIALRLGSPAFNAGSTALAVDGSGNPLTTDQRGMPRVFGSAVDIGAYEAQPLVAPAGLQATAGADQLTLSWIASSGAADYTIYRGIAPGAESAIPIATGVTSTGFIDTGVAAGTTYYYRVAASDAAGTSAAGNEATAVPVLPILNGTSGNDLIVLTADTDNLHIDWKVGTNSGQVLIADPNGLTINGVGGNDTILLNQANGSPLPSVLNLNGTFTVNGLQGSNPLAGRTWNLNSSTVLITYADSTADPASIIQRYLANGYNNGGWNGASTASTGTITSAIAAAGPLNTFGLGYADSADGVVIGQPANTIEIRYTLMGDANLDRVVNLSDAQRLQANWNATGTPSWDRGNFNYDSSVNLSDALFITRNWNVAATGSTAAEISASAEEIQAGSEPAVELPANGPPTSTDSATDVMPSIDSRRTPFTRVSHRRTVLI